MFYITKGRMGLSLGFIAKTIMELGAKKGQKEAFF